MGSTLHGLALDGQDDTDTMGVFIEPPRYVLGLARSSRYVSDGVTRYEELQHFVARSKPDGVRSGPDDVDAVYYTLKKYIKLALSGNPSVLLLLFAPESSCQTLTDYGRALQEMAPYLVSRQAGGAYLGYLRNQRDKLLGLKSNRVHRPELIDAHGYDTKFAMHALRLGYQGIELLETGRLVLPIEPGIRQAIMNVRRGEVPLESVVATLQQMEGELTALVEGGSPLPEGPDLEAINRWLALTYLEYWNETGAVL